MINTPLLMAQRRELVRFLREVIAAFEAGHMDIVAAMLQDAKQQLDDEVTD